jgi:hypothetical protein
MARHGGCGRGNSTPATWLAGESEGSLALDHLGPLEVAQRAPQRRLKPPAPPKFQPCDNCTTSLQVYNDTTSGPHDADCDGMHGNVHCVRIMRR